MRCLLLAEGDARTFDSWSGISSQVVDNLERAGHKVFDVNCDLSGPMRFAAAAASWSPHRKRWWVRYHLGPAGFRLRSRRAAEAVDRFGRDVDYILQFGATFDPGVGGRNLPLFLYCDGNAAVSRDGMTGGASEAAFLTNDEILGVFKREADIYRRAEKIFTFSEHLEESFKGDFGVDVSAVQTVYAGANLDPRTVLSDPDTRAAGFPTILFVGRDFERKGGDVLLQAFSRVRREVPQAQLNVVGCNPRIPDDSGVTVYGRIDRDREDGETLIRRLFSEASIFAMPTRYEGLSISFLEAMCFSLPCVGVSSAWSPAEMIEDGKTGFTVDVDDVDAFTAALLRLCTDPALAAQMGAAGRDRALEDFTWSKVVGKMLHSIEETVG